MLKTKATGSGPEGSAPMSAHRPVQSASLHDQMVRGLANHLWGEGWTNVRADLRSWALGSPPVVGHYRPDIYAVDRHRIEWIFEVETSDSIGIAHTREQWRQFSLSTYRFGILVPAAALGDAQLAANLYGIDVDAWWSEP